METFPYRFWSAYDKDLVPLEPNRMGLLTHQPRFFVYDDRCLPQKKCLIDVLYIEIHMGTKPSSNISDEATEKEEKEGEYRTDDCQGAREPEAHKGKSMTADRNNYPRRAFSYGK